MGLNVYLDTIFILSSTIFCLLFVSFIIFSYGMN